MDAVRARLFIERATMRMITCESGQFWAVRKMTGGLPENTCALARSLPIALIRCGMECVRAHAICARAAGVPEINGALFEWECVWFLSGKSYTTIAFSLSCKSCNGGDGGGDGVFSLRDSRQTRRASHSYIIRHCSCAISTLFMQTGFLCCCRRCRHDAIALLCSQSVGGGRGERISNSPFGCMRNDRMRRRRRRPFE